ncbi:DUF3267 domain-containing protein [Thermofilum pendens]|uniref:DUF3267 domain-containing protein n=1 Tax=Thermofilum pendens (strain DSM 2475 / Hrk 5) TaxID=368408 RepID=A1S0D9_THEPD|nr:DUF3267 domain-containing protein [Thermofilum pendens]ABL78919.1 hypothetical protein Tpen_1522 [Thermofilum pendens Hrk 5]
MQGERCYVSVKESLAAVAGFALLLFYVAVLLLGSFTPPADLVVFALGVLATLALHEGIHVAVAYAFGARGISVKPFRASWILVGVYVSTKTSLRRDEWLVVALAPLLVLTPAALVAAKTLEGLARETAEFIVVFNTMGAGGDLFLALAVLLSAKRDALIHDEGERVVFEGSCSRVAALTSIGKAVLAFSATFCCLWLGVLALCAFLRLDVEALGVRLIETEKAAGYAARLTNAGLATFLAVALIAALLVGLAEYKKLGRMGEASAKAGEKKDNFSATASS